MRHQSDLGAAGAAYIHPLLPNQRTPLRWQYDDDAGAYWTQRRGNTIFVAHINTSRRLDIIVW